MDPHPRPSYKVLRDDVRMGLAIELFFQVHLFRSSQTKQERNCKVLSIAHFLSPRLVFWPSEGWLLQLVASCDSGLSLA